MQNEFVFILASMRSEFFFFFFRAYFIDTRHHITVNLKHIFNKMNLTMVLI